MSLRANAKLRHIWHWQQRDRFKDCAPIIVFNSLVRINVDNAEMFFILCWTWGRLWRDWRLVLKRGSLPILSLLDRDPHRLHMQRVPTHADLRAPILILQSDIDQHS